ncbi:hypothetical protein BSPP4475_05915 [Brevibacillus aydinogluensis]|uniref:Uncharacterized protein n=1 Tax=Brevibacillus aydinogluensis TaxID=927786 RepID=A0AA48MA53_9BACL|nr:hypothetical protein BSPP4475_05915 [Brevibacillus aydinogluensis]
MKKGADSSRVSFREMLKHLGNAVSFEQYGLIQAEMMQKHYRKTKREQGHSLAREAGREWFFLCR